jgi:hypothetical protein
MAKVLMNGLSNPTRSEESSSENFRDNILFPILISLMKVRYWELMITTFELKAAAIKLPSVEYVISEDPDNEYGF